MANEYWILKDDQNHFYWRIAATPDEAAAAWREATAQSPKRHWRSIRVTEYEPATMAAEPALADVEGPHDYVPTVRQLSRHVTDLRVALQRQIEQMRADHDAAMVKQNERLTELEAAREEHWERMNDMIGVVEERATGWNGRIAYLERLLSVPDPSGKPRLVRAAFDEEWAPNLAVLLPNINWVGVNPNGLMSGAETDFDIEDRLWTGAGEIQALGYVDIELHNINWRTSKRKVIR